MEPSGTACVGGGRGIVIRKWLLENGGIGNGYWILENWVFENALFVIGQCNRALAGITFFFYEQ